MKLKVFATALICSVYLLGCGGDTKESTTRLLAETTVINGVSTGVLPGARANYTVAKSGETYSVTDIAGNSGTSVFTNITRLQFSDGGLAFDTSGNAGKAYRLYQAAFNRSPDLAGLGLWIEALDQGLSLTEASRRFAGSTEFINLYGSNISSATFVTLLYRNVLHREPEDAALPFWVNILDSGQQSRELVLANFSESAENKAQVLNAIENGIQFTPTIQPGISLVAGSTNIPLFGWPGSIAKDSLGNVYVVDSGLHKIEPSGNVVTIAPFQADSTLLVDQSGAPARFANPRKITIDSADNIYVIDVNMIRKITPAGIVSTLAGNDQAAYSTSVDGTGTNATFKSLNSLAVDATGNVYATDMHLVRKISSSGVVTTIAGKTDVPGTFGDGSGTADGNGTSAQFHTLKGIALDKSNNLYVADYNNHTIRKISPSGNVTTFAGLAGTEGDSDGTGSTARFRYPSALAIAADDNIYVGDSAGMRKITPASGVSTLGAGYGNIDGPIATAKFSYIQDIFADSAGSLFVADANAARKISSTGIVSTLVGTRGDDDGIGAAAQFSGPNAITLSGSGDFYVADSINHLIRKITPDGVVTTFAGGPYGGGLFNGVGTGAQFNYPNGITTDTAGNLYVTEWGNNDVRKITVAGVVSTFAGAGASGYVDATGVLAKFSSPMGIAADAAGNLYVADANNCAIRKISPARAVTTFAGTAGQCGSDDGTGTSARFSGVNSIAVDTAGNLYVTDNGNNTVRKITSSGVVTTLAGKATMSGNTDGQGTAARFNRPSGIDVDAVGNVYVADTVNNTIRKITATGLVTTIAGIPGQINIVQGGTLPGHIYLPTGIKVTGANTLMFTAGNGVFKLIFR